VQEDIIDQTTQAHDQLASTRSRIVQSPDRKRRNIDLMRTTVEDHRRAIAANEAKIRELQAKQAAFANIERVRAVEVPCAVQGLVC
jgi:kinetochore protein Nuf2